MNKSIRIKEDESSYSNDDYSLKREAGFTPEEGYTVIIKPMEEKGA